MRQAAEAEAARLRTDRDGWMKASDVANAEATRLRAQVATLRQPLAVIYDLCQFHKDVGKGNLLVPSLERDVLEALATTNNSGQDAR